MIGTHASNYHSDDVTGPVILKYTNEFKNHKVIRTHDPNELSQCDLIFDIGAVYDHSKKMYDHHQRGYYETFTKHHKVKLCGCGLLFKHYGNEIIQNALKSLNLKPIDDDKIEIFKVLMYDNFFVVIDANDNGIDCAESEILFKDNTSLPYRIARLNARKEPFENAQKIAEEMFLDILQYCYDLMINQFPIVEKAYNERFSVHPSGRIMLINSGVSCRDCIEFIQKLNGKEEEILYYIMPDLGRGHWKCTALEKKNSFNSLKKFPENWRGLRNEELCKVCGVDGAVFCHASGFLISHQTFDGIMKMTVLALEN